jgi:pimeloyl-ACP methyl ester carboxylesterase
VAQADEPQDSRPAPKAKPGASADAGPVRKAEKAASRKPGPSLFQRIFGARTAARDALPHARFSDTPLGVRSYVVAGHGSPTVVLESGLGHGKRVWGPVFDGVSSVTRVVAYDRAGYGQSEASDQPRSGLQIVAELRALLQTEGLGPPYVLVGHSLGGTYMKLFAKMHPDEVAGVVLVDARHSEFTQRCRQLGVPRLLYEPPEALLRLLAPTPRAELEAAPLTLKQARKGGTFPSVPLIVLTQSNAAQRWPAQLGKVWAASQRNLVKLSSLGRIKVLDGSGHNVHLDRPEVVVRAILNVVRAARYLQHQANKRGLAA